MSIKLTPKQRLALIVFTDYRCEICMRLGRNIQLPAEELEVHRIRAGYENGTYESFRSLMVLCKLHHDQISSAQRINLGIQN